MELRRVDPRTLKSQPQQPAQNPARRNVGRGAYASIKAVGIIQPPTVAEKDGDLTIAYGARRVRFAIEIGLPEINVLVKDPDDHDEMRAVSENVVRAPMATVDLWRAIESLASENWTEEAIAAALAVPLRQIRKLRLLATVHPAILDQIGAGDMPKERELRTIASAPREDQAAAWKKLKPKKGEGAIWWQIAQALEKTRFFAKDAKFGEDERAAFAHRLAGRPLCRRGRRQSLHRRRRGFRVRPARLARRPHAEERRLARDRRIRPRETAAQGATHLDEAEEGRPDRLHNPSARRHDPRTRLPHARGGNEERQDDALDRRRQRRGARAEEDPTRDHLQGNGDHRRVAHRGAGQGPRSEPYR